MTITRDAQGRVTQITEPAGRALTFSYTGTNLRTDKVTDPIGRTVQYSYDASGRLASVTDPAGGVTTYTYDATGRLVTITDPRNIPFLINEYDGAGRVCRQTQADGRVWLFYYIPADAAGTGPGQTLLAQAGAGGPITLSPCTLLGSAPTILATVVVDSRGQPTTHRFNGNAYLLARTNPVGQETRFDRASGTNLLRSTTDPLGRVTRQEYDAAGNVISLTDPAGNTRRFEYDPTVNRLTRRTDPLGNATTYAYDAQGNLVSVTDPLGASTRNTYDAFGHPTSSTDPLGNTTTFAYNAQGDLVGITEPQGSTTTLEYDLASRLIRQIDPEGKVTTFDYDPLNRLTSIVDALGGATAFTYDATGNLLAVTDARGNTITHEYDAMNQLIRRIDPSGRAEAFSYDARGNLQSTTDRKSQTTTFEYDALGRRTRVTYGDGSVVTFAYDAAGRLVQADDTADPHRPITLEYDARGRLVAEATALGTVSYAYDTLGRRSQMTVSGQPPVTYTYDAASRLRSLSQPPLNPVTIEFDPAGRRTRLTLPNGVSTEYGYDAASRVTALTYRTALGGLGDLTYQYDAGGNRIAVGGSFARTLHPDPVATATYDAANRQLAFGAKTMGFDANGNLASLTDGSGTTTFAWDARNRLLGINGPGIAAAFGYDAFGRRVTKALSAQTVRYLYDRADIVAEIDGQTRTAYLRSLGVDEALGRLGPAEIHLALQDALGSTVALTDPAGTAAVQYTYGPFGATAASSPLAPHPFQFTGRENDGTGLYFYRARYYQPDLSRFLSEDPLRQAGGINFYAYVGNNPVNHVDPSGLKLDLSLTSTPDGAF